MGMGDHSRHPETGFTILKDIPFAWPVAEIVRQHHERLDGSGYPLGLKGDAIVPEAKVLAVADIVEAMSAFRPYRPGHELEAALLEIEKQAGSLLDPKLLRFARPSSGTRGLPCPVFPILDPKNASVGLSLPSRVFLATKARARATALTHDSMTRLAVFSYRLIFPVAPQSLKLAVERS